MSVLHTPRRVRGVLGTIALALGVILAPVSAAPAQAAAIPCPTATMSSPAISSWETEYANHGVTLCTGLFGSGNVVVKVQIVDLAAGAALYHAAGAVTPAPNFADNTIERKTIGQWATLHDVTGGFNGGSWPNNPDVFSVTNGAFFTSTSTPTTKMSLPLKGVGQVQSRGYAIYGTDPAWNTPKRVMYMHETPAGSSPFSLRISSFPTFYTNADSDCGGWHNCIVGFDPLQDPTGNNATTAFRTYVGTKSALGTNTTRAYILTTGQPMTVAQANAVLTHFGASAKIQLDGGGSTNMASFAGNLQPTPGNRALPHVLAVLYAPN